MSTIHLGPLHSLAVCNRLDLARCVGQWLRSEIGQRGKLTAERLGVDNSGATVGYKRLGHAIIIPAELS